MKKFAPAVTPFLLAFLFRGDSKSARSVAVAARLVVGFLQHGIAKLSAVPDRFSANLAGLGVPVPDIMGALTIAFEIGCGAAMLLGVFVPAICIPMTVILLVALLFVHLPYGFSSIKLQAVTPEGIKFGPPGYEVILLYFVCLWALFLLGPGPYSVDAWLGKKLKG